jgi:hypothetical protein
MMPVRSPEESLAAGCAVLAPILALQGFVWVPGASGHSSGGDFASGSFIRGTRRLELHFRHSLGLVTYHVGDTSLDHEAYMRVVLGAKGGNQYPGFSSDPIDGFRHLAHDLSEFCQSFLGGPDEEFNGIASGARTNVGKRLP